MKNPRNDRSIWRSPEFVLVSFFLVALLGAIALIFLLTQSLLTDANSKGAKEAVEIVLNHRKDLIAIIVGAFGAWVGAGAAYFFGRENLREATSSILSMKGPTREEILQRTTLADLKPKPLPRVFKATNDEEKKVSTILKWLEEEPDRFFATIVDDQGKVLHVLDEEAIYRYIAAKPPEGKQLLTGDVPIYDASTSTYEQVVKFITEQEGYKKKSKVWQNLIDAASRLKQTDSCALANETLGKERKFVAIVLDDKDVPVGYITNTDIWKLITSVSR